MGTCRHLKLTENRLERAFLNLPRFLATQAEVEAGAGADPTGGRVFISRLIIALNSMARDLQDADDESLRSVADRIADLLWSVGEMYGEQDDRFSLRDDAREVHREDRA